MDTFGRQFVNTGVWDTILVNCSVHVCMKIVAIENVSWDLCDPALSFLFKHDVFRCSCLRTSETSIYLRSYKSHPTKVS